MNVAVTGATGFLGGHVVRALMQHGERPTLVVRPGRTIEADLAELHRVEVDFLNPHDDIYACLGRPDVLIHLAWGGLPNYRSPHHVETELPMHRRLLERLIRSGLPRLVVAGTCFEYGMQSGELSESTPTRPDNAYGQAKDLLRQDLQSLQQRHGFDLTWARLFYLFGEDQPARSLYPMLRDAAMKGDRFFPMSGGQQVRDFLPVDQAAAMIVRLSRQQGGAGVVNVCSGRPITVLEIVEQWIADHGWEISPQTGVYPYPDYEPMAFWGSIEHYERICQDARA